VRIRNRGRKEFRWDSVVACRKDEVMRRREEGGLEKVRLLVVRMKSRKKEGYAGGERH